MIKSYLNQHKKYTKNKVVVTKTQLTAGDVVDFLYKDEKRLVFILNAKWDGKLHGLSLTDISRERLKRIFKADVGRLSPQAFYDKYSKYFDGSYRTYNLNKIRHLQKVAYEV